MDYVMTAEKRQELLGLLPFSIDSRLEYMPKPYLMKHETVNGIEGDYVVPEDLRPTFVLRPMSRKELDALKLKSGKTKVDDEGLITLVSNVVVGWKNLYDIGTLTPVEIEYKEAPGGGADRELFKKAVTYPVIADLAMCIVKMNGILGAEYLGFA